MKTTAKVLQMVIRLCGLVLIILGGLMWAGKAMTLMNVHIMLGLALVVALWVLAVLAFRVPGGAGLGIVALAWGLLAAYVGFRQIGWLGGADATLIRVIHLLLGLGAIGLGEMLGGRIKKSGAAA